MQNLHANAAEIQAPFAAARALLADAARQLGSGDLMHATHDQVEQFAVGQGRAIVRSLLQDHFALRARAEPAEPVVGFDGRERTHRRDDCKRTLHTTVGPVPIARTAFSGRELGALHPVDAALNLPADSYSFELAKRVAETAAEVSFERAGAQVEAFTGVRVGLRQVEQLTQAAAKDFDGFYGSERSLPTPPNAGDLLVMTSDHKGVVMRKEALREDTRARADAAVHTLTTRLTKGEKRDRKRMATVAAVYTVAPHMRSAADVIAGLRRLRDVERVQRTRPPKPQGKRVWASVVDDLDLVVAQMFDEAERRDPDHRLRWLALVDGEVRLERAIRAEAKRRGVEVTLVLDFIHALEYLWKAGHALHAEGTPELEAWVLARLDLLLQGKASDVAAGMRRSATKRGLSAKDRKPIDIAAAYLLKRKDMMPYGELLALGAPIASGVIEGTCRSLVNDRMDLTGARWSVAGAEAVLRLRAVIRSGDWQDYWAFHTQAEYVANHASAYAKCAPPPVVFSRGRGKLRLVSKGREVSL
jgi:hypothetical protein